MAYGAVETQYNATISPGQTYLFGCRKLTAAETALAALEAEGVEDVQGDKLQSTKVLRDGQLYILRGGKTFTVQGQEVK